MKSVIIHDTSDDFGREILHYLKQKTDLSNRQFHFFDLAELSMQACYGCFGCWIKTPGKCVFRDDIENIMKEEINSSRVLYLCPVTWGSYSPLLKIFKDRSIGMALPFFEIYRGETHHPKRYKNYPEPLLAGYGTDLEDDECELFRKTGENLNDNIHKGNLNTLIIKSKNDFSYLDCFFNGGNL